MIVINIDKFSFDFSFIFSFYIFFWKVRSRFVFIFEKFVVYFIVINVLILYLIGNIFLGSGSVSGEIKITDFGFSKIMDEENIISDGMDFIF